MIAQIQEDWLSALPDMLRDSVKDHDLRAFNFAAGEEPKGPNPVVWSAFLNGELSHDIFAL